MYKFELEDCINDNGSMPLLFVNTYLTKSEITNKYTGLIEGVVPGLELSESVNDNE